MKTQSETGTPEETETEAEWTDAPAGEAPGDNPEYEYVRAAGHTIPGTDEWIPGRLLRRKKSASTLEKEAERAQEQRESEETREEANRRPQSTAERPPRPQRQGRQVVPFEYGIGGPKLEIEIPEHGQSWRYVNEENGGRGGRLVSTNDSLAKRRAGEETPFVESRHGVHITPQPAVKEKKELVPNPDYDPERDPEDEKYLKNPLYDPETDSPDKKYKKRTVVDSQGMPVYEQDRGVADYKPRRVTRLMQLATMGATERAEKSRARRRIMQLLGKPKHKIEPDPRGPELRQRVRDSKPDSKL